MLTILSLSIPKHHGKKRPCVVQRTTFRQKGQRWLFLFAWHSAQITWPPRVGQVASGWLGWFTLKWTNNLNHNEKRLAPLGIPQFPLITAKLHGTKAISGRISEQMAQVSIKPPTTWQRQVLFKLFMATFQLETFPTERWAHGAPWSSMVCFLVRDPASGSSSTDSLGNRFQEAWTASSETNLEGYVW